jgi:threonine 3-dehydrogenase
MKVLLLGAYGQVGQELIKALSARIGMSNLVCADIRPAPSHLKVENHVTLNSMDTAALDKTIENYKIDEIYCLTALLSATGETNPLFT